MTTGSRHPAAQVAARTPAAGPRGGGEVMGDGRSALATVRSRLWRARPLLVGAVVLLIIVVLTLLSGTGDDDAPLSPGNAGPEGARAVAEVLAAQGVEIRRPASYEEADALLGEGPATLFLNDPQQYLSATQLTELGTAADRAVLAAPGERQLSALPGGFDLVGPLPFDPGGDAPPPSAQCEDSGAVAAGTITATGTAYSGPVTCFPETIEDLSGGLYVTSADGAVAVLGAPTILANRSITDEGNAALALASLGSSPTLVWFEPTAADVVAVGEGIDPLTLLPGWVDVLLVWLLVCGILAMIWRGRRMGPLATEPLPVLVHAAETAEGRARLYQDSDAVAHAAANLRAATLVRLARHLRLDRSATAPEILDAAARQGGRSRSELAERLLENTPTTNRELVPWAQELLDLEKEITST
ncbi:DUF4350 domain-containing protein [Arthrobacter echini]|uniref:DUF4350 domain-containing protein n=1 Tax=Arthrobacter echini TaxID=1529066 RepID=A0A4S5E3M4_9MICC|nr:DUF4350 domain-containing protein [Arthrobacter echini]THJ65982.1 DUF4350 domain-containing protein [Arthrobacter echini]